METEPLGTARSRWSPPRALDTAAAVAMAVVASGALIHISRRSWFHSDAWDFLVNRALSDPRSLVEPHAGHWQTPTVLVYRVLQTGWGMDFFPWYLLPTVVGYSLLAVWLWRVLLRRGTARHTALAAMALFLVLGSSGWHNASTIGNLIVVAGAYRVALLLAETASPRRRDLWLLFALLGIVVMSSSLGVAVLTATLATVAISRRRWRWLPAVAGAGAFYAVWYVVFRLSAPASTSPDPTALTSVPEYVARILANAARITLGVGESLGLALAVAVMALLVVLAIRKRLDPFDILLLITAVGFVAMVAAVRLAAGSAQVTATRYAYNITVLLLPVIVPRLAPARAGWAAWIVTGALVVSIPTNWSTLRGGIDFWENRAQASREVVETAAALLAAGEPFLASSAVDPPRAGMLTVDGLEVLTDGGWSPTPSPNEEIVEVARSYLRFDVRPTFAAGGTAPQTAASIDADGCASLEMPGSVSLAVSAAGGVTIETTDEAQLDIVWIDEYGTGRRTVSLESPDRLLRLAGPTTTAELHIGAIEGAVRICGVTHAG